MDPAVLGSLDPGGRYRMIRKIGWGKWATTYAALDTQNQEEVVVKCMKLHDIDVAAREHLMTYLQREVDNHSRLNHPNIINVKGAFLTTIPFQPHTQQHTHFCLALELASAGNLLEHYRDYHDVFQCSFPPLRARWFLQQLVLALEYLHSVGLSHRDIKPDNIVLKVDPGCPMPILKLADFGVSSNCDDTPNRVNSVVGTRIYYAPEMLVKERREALTQRLNTLTEQENRLSEMHPVDHQRNKDAQTQIQTLLDHLPNFGSRTQPHNTPQENNTVLYDGTKIDMWSCGVVLYYMLTGEPAFGMRTVDNPRRHMPGQDPQIWEDLSYDQHIQQIQRGPQLHHEVFRPPEGEPICRLLRALLAFNPHDRPSIEQLRNPQYFPWFADGMPAGNGISAQQQGPPCPVRVLRVSSKLTSVVEDARKILMNQGAQPQAMMM